MNYFVNNAMIKYYTDFYMYLQFKIPYFGSRIHMIGNKKQTEEA